MSNHIYDLVQQCQIARNNIQLAINTQPFVVFKSRVLILAKSIKNIYPNHSVLLEKNLNSNLEIKNILYIVDTILLLIEKEEQGYDRRKIFISHSSKDDGVIKIFVEKILQLGIGINHNDIFCTSIDGMNIRTGEDIRKHIKDNLKYCDYAFLMISRNYNKSFVCLNEMGAAWALDKQVRPYLLPNTTLKALSWTLNPAIASVLGEKSTLNMLHDELCEKYALNKNSTTWGDHKNDFLNYIAK